MSHAPAEPPPRRRRRLSAQERRELILDGAMRVFAERGYEAASMPEIARAGGITAAVVYDHFGSKAELHVELLERQTAALLGCVADALTAAPADPAARMHAGVDAFFRFVEEHRFTWRLMFRDPPSDPAVAAAYLRLDREATAAIAGFIAANAGDALATFPDPERSARMFAEALKAAQNGLAAWWFEHPQVAREEVVQHLLDFCWTGMERLAAHQPRTSSVTPAARR